MSPAALRLAILVMAFLTSIGRGILPCSWSTSRWLISSRTDSSIGLMLLKTFSKYLQKTSPVSSSDLVNEPSGLRSFEFRGFDWWPQKPLFIRLSASKDLKAPPPFNLLARLPHPSLFCDLYDSFQRFAGPTKLLIVGAIFIQSTQEEVVVMTEFCVHSLDFHYRVPLSIS